MQAIQRALSLVYPPQCVLCAEPVEAGGALCADCWREAGFIFGAACDLCGLALPGPSDGGADLCDDCLRIPRPWSKGRAVLAYEGAGRRLVLALKHGDRTDLAIPAAAWMARRGRDVLTAGRVLVPVPSHWSRRIARRYVPAAELSRALARRTGLSHRPEVLVRRRKTETQDGKSVEARFANVEGAIAAHPKHGGSLDGKQVCLIDDVMTSGATLAAASAACLAAGASEVCVLVLARVAKSP